MHNTTVTKNIENPLSVVKMQLSMLRRRRWKWLIRTSPYRIYHRLVSLPLILAS
jgi:hypothetical protein